jgi:hypothetical protein
MIASADTNIADVLTSVQEDFGKSDEPGDDDMEEELLGSLELSVSPSQSVDGTEPVTQLSDVPDQLAAEEKKVAEKKIRAYERRKFKAARLDFEPLAVVPPSREGRSKAVHDPADSTAEVDPDILIERAKKRKSMAAQNDPADPSPAADVSVPTSHASQKKSRVAVAKKKQKLDVAGSPRRSPRVVGSKPEGSLRQSPRILQQKEASPLGKRKSTTSKVKQVGNYVFSFCFSVYFLFFIFSDFCCT